MHARASPSSWSHSVRPFSWLCFAAAALLYSPALSAWSPLLHSHTVSCTHICIVLWGCVHAASVGFRVQCTGCVHVDMVSCAAMRFALCDLVGALWCCLGVVDFIVTTCTYPDLLDSFPSSVPCSIFGQRVWWVVRTVRWCYWLSTFAVGRGGVSGLFMDLSTRHLGLLRLRCGCTRDFRAMRIAGGLSKCLDAFGHAQLPLCEALPLTEGAGPLVGFNNC